MSSSIPRALDPRIKAFCDWLDTIPAEPPFHTRPEYRFYADLTDDQIATAMAEMRRRATRALAEAASLDVERDRRRSADHIAPIPTTREQDLMIEIMMQDAFAVSGDVTVAAELLMGAAGAILARNYAPDAALNLLEMMFEGGRQAFKEIITPVGVPKPKRPCDGDDASVFEAHAAWTRQTEDAE